MRKHLDRKWEAVERCCDTLATSSEERSKAEAIKNRLSEIERDNQALRDHLELPDNRQLDSLILRCKDVGAREPGEDIESKTVAVLKSKLTGLNLSRNDIQTVHRLASENNVI